MKIKKCLIIEWTKLPQNLKEDVRHWNNFGNDCLFSLPTEFSMKDFAKGMIAVEEYWTDQVNTNGFKGNLKEFIEEYGLEFDVWLMKKTNIDWEGIDEILIEVCW